MKVMIVQSCLMQKKIEKKAEFVRKHSGICECSSLLIVKQSKELDRSYKGNELNN